MSVRLAVLALCSLATLPVLPQKPPPIVIKRHFSVSDRAAGRYQYVPFEVPAGVHRLRISYAYGREGGNTVDLGLFEPGSLDFGTSAFRGWSGGERDTIEIGERWSSPGYRVGPVRQGQWHVALGLYRVGDRGVDVTLIVELDPQGSLEPPPVAGPSIGAPPNEGSLESAMREPDAVRGPRWWHGDLHVHSEHSDGKHSVRDVARLAVASGLDFIVLTDHNNTTHQRDVNGVTMPLIISGEEVTTPGGHANVWGLGPDEWLDFRFGPRDPHLEDVVRGAHARGALFSINHPFISCDQCSWTHEVPAELDALEIWNGPLGPQADAVLMWERLLQAGRRVTAVASSDWHRAVAPLGAGSVRVFASSLAETPLLEAIRQGHVILMRDAAAPAPRVIARTARQQAGIGDTLTVERGETVTVEVAVDRFVSPGAAGCPDACRADLVVSNGRRISEPLGGGSAAFRVEPLADAYLRVEITAGSTVLAITNPIWLSIR